MNKYFGFLNINKPPGYTSHDIVAILRKSLGIKKIGHSGTLDPFATGVLIIGINDATRLFEYLPKDKAYIAEILFGIETDTNDTTGSIINKSDYKPDVEEIKKKLALFTGTIQQKPPIYSAIKINGKRAYKLARKNEITTDSINEKTVEIFSIDFISYTQDKLKLKIHCSNGTYIRSIARDLGTSLNTYAVLSSLERTQIGNAFKITDSIDPALINRENLFEYLIKPDLVLPLSKILLNEREIDDIKHGKIIKLASKADFDHTTYLQIIDNKNNLIAIGLLEDSCIIKPKKVLTTNE